MLRLWLLWTTFIRCSPFSWRSFWLRCIVVDPCFIHCHMPTQGILFILIKQLQTELWITNTLLLLLYCEQMRHLFGKQFSEAPNFRSKCCINCFLKSFWCQLSPATSVHGRPKQFWDFFKMFSDIFTSFGRHECSASSVSVHLRLNSGDHRQIVVFDGADFL